MDEADSRRRTQEHHRSSRRLIRKGLPARIRSIPAGCWLAVIVLADVLLALTVRIPALFSTNTRNGFSALDIALLSSVPVIVFAAVQLTRRRRRELAEAAESSDVIDTVMRTSREWLWAVDDAGTFTFSSPVCEQLTGYKPAELVGGPIGLVLDAEDLATALKSQPGTANGSAFTGLVLVCRHRAGHRVLIEVTGNAIDVTAGSSPGFEGTARPVDDLLSTERAADEVRERITALVPGDSIVTAFQPIHCLGSGTIVGAEALSRFPRSGSTSPEAWFMQAASIGMEVELELLALRTAMSAADKLPQDMYLAINLSPRVCLDPRVLATVTQGSIHPSRLVLEVTERQEVDDYEDLLRLLSPLRTSGMRLAIDDAGAGYASMRHIIRLKPDLIKLDRAIIRDIDTEASHRALGAAMVSFAAETGALLVAEGIETTAELNTVTSLGMAAGQGYLLGKPTLEPSDWAQWDQLRATELTAGSQGRPR
ncbi:MAG TPA: EAL domain-containing protein [Arthrobacter sp.]|nr:EAL domain-containing protein [Arthrobacter sp.]